MSEVIWDPTEDQRMMLYRMAVTGGDFSGSDLKEDDGDIESACKDYLDYLKRKAESNPEYKAKVQRAKEDFIRLGMISETEGSD